MATGQPKVLQLDPSPEKTHHTGTEVGLQETPEKKLSSVGFYELEVPHASKKNEATEETKSTGSADVETKEVLSEEKDYLDKAEEKTTQSDASPEYLDKAEEKTTLDIEDQSLDYFDQTAPRSSGLNHRHGILSCLCKECVENLQNKREEVKKTTDTDKEINDEFLPCEDSASIKSNRSNRDSEKSRHTNSYSEEECTGNRLEDAQVTLPYPEKYPPPECITRLSNAGLYEPNEDLGVRSSKAEEDKQSQVVSAAFFVQHPDEKPSQQKKVQLEMVDIEKGETESEPLIRTIRRTVDEEPPDPRICQCNRGCLKIVGSFVTSMIVFPAFLYAAYAWLPFDAPLMPDIPTRLVYTLRCASFASFPIVLGVIIHGISRLCASSYDPFKPKEREVTIHRRFVKQGTFLFVLYFFNLSVLATYLPQDHLKFIPLLTCLFTLAQLIYWLSFAVSRSFRGFGYGLTFFPLIAMMFSNFYFMFLVEPEKMIFLGSRNVPQN
ncbi:transmembrane protein 79 [Rana temporaria]|uniref:transmembrane protein 79 n=1 Tax=Rana temporaria TaxID=8407 RepID=UPI001AAC6857|nr:transmembrane protein 79 [Rana temporaria]